MMMGGAPTGGITTPFELDLTGGDVGQNKGLTGGSILEQHSQFSNDHKNV